LHGSPDGRLPQCLGDLLRTLAALKRIRQRIGGKPAARGVVGVLITGDIDAFRASRLQDPQHLAGSTPGVRTKGLDMRDLNGRPGLAANVDDLPDGRDEADASAPLIPDVAGHDRSMAASEACQLHELLRRGEGARGKA
jgi:hypothetical protein